MTGPYGRPVRWIVTDDERYGLQAQVLATKGDIAASNARIAETKADITRSMLGALTAQTALLLGAKKLL